MPFPRERFIRAGAGPDMIDTLRAGYDALPPAAKDAYDAELAGISDGAIAERLMLVDVSGVDDPEPAPEDGGITLSDGSTVD